MIEVPAIDQLFEPVLAPAAPRGLGRARRWPPGRCGNAAGGAIIRVLQESGIATCGSDIVPDPEHGVIAADILRTEQAMAGKVVTNPPFAIAGEIIAHLLARLNVDYLALLVKAQFWHAEERRSLFEAYPPARIWALTWRPDFMGGGNPTMDCIWTVWDRSHTGPTTYGPLTRDRVGQGALL